METKHTESIFWQHEPFTSVRRWLQPSDEDCFELALQDYIPTNKTLWHCIIWLCLKNTYTVKQLAEIFKRDEKVIRYYCNKLVSDGLIKKSKNGKQLQFTASMQADSLQELIVNVFMNK